MSADDNAPEQAREVEVVVAFEYEGRRPTDDEWSILRVLDSHHLAGDRGTLRPDTPGWRRCQCGAELFWTDYHPHLAQEIAKALAPLRAGERQEAARAALIEAAGDIAERIAAVVDPDPWRRDGFDEGWAHAGEKIDGLLRARADGVTGRSGT